MALSCALFWEIGILSVNKTLKPKGKHGGKGQTLIHTKIQLLVQLSMAFISVRFFFLFQDRTECGGEFG